MVKKQLKNNYFKFWYLTFGIKLKDFLYNTSFYFKFFKSFLKRGLSLKIKNKIKKFTIFLKKNKTQSFFLLVLVVLNYYRQVLTLSLKQRNFLKEVVFFLKPNQKVSFFFKEFSKVIKKNNFFLNSFLKNYFNLVIGTKSHFNNTYSLDKKVFLNKNNFVRKKKKSLNTKFKYRFLFKKKNVVYKKKNT
jgi:hypothetical protein